MNSGVVGHFIERTLEGAFGRRAIVADDHVDQGVVQNFQVFQGRDDSSDLVVGMLHESGIDFHLPFQYGLQLGIHVLPGRNFGVAWCEFCVRPNHP